MPARGYGDTTVVVPTFNEADTLPRLIPALQAVLPGVHILVADDGSTDGTREHVRSRASSDPTVRLLDRAGRDRGLTAAVADGLLLVQTPVAVVMDADFQHPVEAVDRLVRSIRHGADIAVGRRGSLEGLSGPRKIVSAGAAALAHAYLGATRRARASDVMSGFFAISAPLAKDLVHRHGDRFERAGFKVLLDLLKAAPRTCRVADVPYRFHPRAGGESKIGLGHARSLLRQLGPLGRAAAAASSPRALRFAAVGGSGVVVNLGLFALLLRIDALPLAAASALAVEGAILWNFGLNRAWTWRDRRGPFVDDLARFHAVSWTALAANVVLLLALVTLGTAPMLGQAAGIAAGTGLNFAGHHLWTFAPAGTRSATRARWYALALLCHAALAAGFADPETAFKLTSSVHALLGGGAPTAVGPVPLALVTSLLVPFEALGGGPMVLRLALKVPIVLAVLASALAVRWILAPRVGAATAAVAERIVLMNPLTFVMIAFGSLEAIAAAALLLAIVAIDRGRPLAAGALIGAGVLTGPVLAAAVPVIVLWAARDNGAAAARRFAAGAFGVVAVGLLLWAQVVAPVHLLDAGLGLASKRPDGMSAARLAEYPAWLGWVGVSAPGVPTGLVVTASLAAMGLVVLGASSVAAAGGGLERLTLALALLGAGLVATLPIVTASDLFAPLVLMGVVAVVPEARRLLPRHSARRILLWGTPLVAVAALLHDGRAALLLPPDVALRFFGASADTLVSGAVGTMGVTRPVTGVVLGAVAAVLHATVVVLLVRAAAPCLLDALPTPRIRLPAGTASRRAAAAALVLALLVPPSAAASVILDTATHGGMPALPRGSDGERHLALLVRTGWTNPAADPTLRYGPWLDARTTPLEGYYETSAATVAKALWAAHGLGAGTVAIDAVPWDLDGFGLAASVATRAGFRVVAVVDIGAIVGDPGLAGADGRAAADERAGRAIDGAVLRAVTALDHAARPRASAEGTTVLLLGVDDLRPGTVSLDTFWDRRQSVAGLAGARLVALGTAPIPSAPAASPDETPQQWAARTLASGLGVAYVPLEAGPVPGTFDVERTSALIDAAPADHLVVVRGWNDHAAGLALEPTLELGDAGAALVARR